MNITKATINKYETLFIGGIKPNTTRANLYLHFMKFGEILEINLKMNQKTNCNKGYAFLVFKDPETIQKVLSFPQVIDNRTVECKVSYGGQYNQIDRFESAKSKIYVYNLSPSVVCEDLRKFFSRYGE